MVYAKLMELMGRLAELGLVHCDFNEFNVLVRRCSAVCSNPVPHNFTVRLILCECKDVEVLLRQSDSLHGKDLGILRLYPKHFSLNPSSYCAACTDGICTHVSYVASTSQCPSIAQQPPLAQKHITKYAQSLASTRLCGISQQATLPLTPSAMQHLDWQRRGLSG